MFESLVPRRRGRFSIAVIVALSLAVAASGCSNETSGTAPSAPPSASPPVDDVASLDGADGRVAAAPDSLTQAGIQVLEDGDQLTEVTGPVLITRVQSDRMLADVGPQSGVLGMDLDAIAPLPADVPPMSYFVASWVTTADTVGAATARSWMGKQDWNDAPHVRFPDAVVLMFVQDAAVATQAEQPPVEPAIDLSRFLPLGPEPVGESASGFRAAPQRADAGPCTTVLNFVGTAIGSIVNALRITPIEGGGAVADVGNFFVGLINGAVALAGGIIQGLINTITAPVLALLRVGIGALAVSTIFVSLFRDLTVRVELVPGQGAQDYHFAVGDAADVKGQLVARSESLTGQWPGILTDCAQAVGMPLPTATGAGAPANWTIEQGAGLITTGNLAGKVGDDLSARLDFSLGRETVIDHTKGNPSNSNVFVRVRIPRKAVEDLLQFGRDTVVSAKQALLSQVPLAPLRLLVDTALSAVIDPLLNKLQSEIVGGTAGRFTLSGIGQVNVGFHTPPATSTTPPPTTIPDTAPDDTVPGDFCALFSALVDFAASSDSVDIVPWAQEVVRQLEAMRPVAPAELLGDVDIMLGVYRAVVASADILTQIEVTLPLGEATARIAAICGISFPPGG